MFAMGRFIRLFILWSPSHLRRAFMPYGEKTGRTAVRLPAQPAIDQNLCDTEKLLLCIFFRSKVIRASRNAQASNLPGLIKNDVTSCIPKVAAALFLDDEMNYIAPVFFLFHQKAASRERLI